MKTVIVTGATGGLGQAVVHYLLDRNFTVIGFSEKDTVDYHSDHYFPVEVNLAVGLPLQFALGGSRTPDALVHLVGGYNGGASAMLTPPNTWREQFDVNVMAAVNVLRSVLPVMVQQGRGRIVAIGSRQAVEPMAGCSAYNASKAALVSLIQTVALENKDNGITANVILPAALDTHSNRTDPNSTPELRSKLIDLYTIAELIHFLIVSDAGAQITGAAIPVYGRAL